MSSFEEMWKVIIFFGIVWVVYTLVIIYKSKTCGKHFMNNENVLFMGYVGLTIGLMVSAIMSLMRL